GTRRAGGRGDEAVEGAYVAGVEAQCHGLLTCRFHQPHHRLGFRQIRVVSKDRAYATLCQIEHSIAAQATAAASYDCDFHAQTPSKESEESLGKSRNWRNVRSDPVLAYSCMAA